ncbi:Uncharacterised protein [Bordetella pertussis]|nr:Uncharacterised protein [Bordetella pertussis]
MRPYTRRGLRAWHACGPRPSRSATPGRNPSTSTSARATRSSACSTMAGCFKSAATRQRLRIRRL